VAAVKSSPPEVDRAAAAVAAVAARRARAAVKHAVATRERRALDVAESAWAGDPTAPEATLRVRELLMSIPSVGPTRADHALELLGIARSKRVGGLGVRQRGKLREYLIAREGEAVLPRSRLVVLAGPTAVGKGTVSRYIHANYPNVLLSVSATTRAPRPRRVPRVRHRPQRLPLRHPAAADRCRPGTREERSARDRPAGRAGGQGRHAGGPPGLPAAPELG
jgi:guanylate kinase